MATVSTRRQALADLARERSGAGSGARSLRRLAIAVVILGLVTLALIWLAGFFSTPREVLAVRALVDQQISELERVGRNEVPFGSGGESFGAMFTAMREVPEGYRDQARAELGRLFEARETAEVDSFFGLPPDRRAAELDRRIKAEEERRKARAAKRAAREADRDGPGQGGGAAAASGGSPAGAAGPPGGRRRGDGTEETRNLRSKSRLDRTSAETRARRTEYRRLKDQRRIELGLQPRR
jgi:type IV secretory pathway VirB10-like protein